MTISIPVRPLSGTALRAAWGELHETDIDEAAARCGYVDDQGCPQVDEFIKALRINLLSLTYD